MTANEAAACAVVLAGARAVACYPITPQTLIVERLADLLAGREDVVFANVESEHSMFGYAIASSRVGLRTFTATSSQGLLYAHEQLHRASRERVPLVAVNVNRSVFAPWSLEPDLTDSMSQRDTGWVQLYCSSAQEVLDSVLCGYRIAERVLLPVLVCMEGFLLSHTSEVVDVPAQNDVDDFLPPFEPPSEWLLDPESPRVFSGLPDPLHYAAFQHRVDEAMQEAGTAIDEVAGEFASRFGRVKIGALEITGNPEATSALVTIGTIGDTARQLLVDDADLLIVRVHAYRPFPAAALTAALAHASCICVVDRACAFGALGPLGVDVRALDLPRAEVVTTAVLGVGGTEVTPETLREALGQTTSRERGRLDPIYQAVEA
jgi:pyruvate/2-oxoacid:ferredoxin oxidoreductase alpha subunit